VDLIWDAGGGFPSVITSLVVSKIRNTALLLGSPSLHQRMGGADSEAVVP
jgi:hypothetical protein